MTRNLKRLVTGILFFLSFTGLQAATVVVPLQADFPLLQQLMEAQLFKGRERSVELLNDPEACSSIKLSEPKLSNKNKHLQIETRLKAQLGIQMLDKCAPVLSWSGYAQVISQPVLQADNPQIIKLHVLEIHLLNRDSQRLTSGRLWEQASKRIHPLFDRFQLNLTPAINELKQFLPLFLPQQSQRQLSALIDSLFLQNIQVGESGISAGLNIEAPTVSVINRPEPVLTEQEQALWEQRWQSMDALLTYTVKHYAAQTELTDLRLALLDIFLDARYSLQRALQQDLPQDPVRHWFIDSWSKLIPLLKQISAEHPQHGNLALLTLVTASDVLQALDQLGPSVGLDISVDGLRRLSRLLHVSPGIDPLHYDEALDPELIRLFQMSPVIDQLNKSTIQLWPMRSAHAVERSLNSWVPANHEIEDYLLKIRKLLLETAVKQIKKSSLTAQQQTIYQKLVLATAWQESCWRQYVIEKNKIAPLRSSTADTGIMQINEKVWRGFVDIHRLRWDVAYNANYGAQVLLNYMTRYAINKGEHKQAGGLDNLARSTYSSYNGGPGQYKRYRSTGVAEAHRKIDRVFYDKFQQVKKGRELAVGQCLGQSKALTVKASKEQQVNTNKVSQGRKRVQDESWIKRQKADLFTLQVAVFGSQQAATEFILQQKIQGQFAVYRKRQKKPVHYVVIFSRFEQRKAAEKASKLFVKSQPWIRTFKTVFNDIKH